MSDPLSDPNASPWTRDGDPVDLSKTTEGQGWTQSPPPDQDGWQQPPPPDQGAWQQPPPDQGAWQQPPPLDQGAWQQPPPPDQGAWQQPPPFGQQPPVFGQSPQGYGQDPYGQNPGGQPPFGPPPRQGSGSSKVVWIVLGVVGFIVILIIVAAILLFNVVGDGVEGVVEGLDDVNGEGADVPDGPRLLDTSGSVSGFDGQEQFEFTVTDRTRVQIDVIGSGGLDPVVELFEGSRQIDRDDDGGDGLNSQLIVDLESGTYTVEVTDFGGDDGDFDLIVTDL